MRPFRYSDFEARLMDRDYIRMLQRPRVQFFRGCRTVLDLACGPGIFLELLKEAGIEGLGVDRDETLVEKARLRDLNVLQADLFEYLERGERAYDGMFCSHILEHLPFDRVVRAIELMTGRLNPGGTAVFVLPNPGSIRLHLFGFWRDPEHIRFYTGNLIGSVCQHYGLKVEYSNEEETPNLLETPYMGPISMVPPQSLWGLFSGRKKRTEALLREMNRKIEEYNSKMEKLTEVINKVWSRDDEVVLVARK